jgi:MFS family permease
VPPLRALFGDDAEVLREEAFQLLLLAAVVPIMGTGVVSPVLDSLIDPFGTSAADIGLVVSSFTAPGIVMIPVAGVLADRYGRKPVLVASLVLFGAAGTAIAFTTDFRVVLALRLLQGVGFGGTNPIIITSIGDLYAGSREATGQGLRFTVSGLSGASFPLIAGLVVVLGWQYPFLLYAVAFPIAALIFLRFEEPTDTGRDDATVTDGGEQQSSEYARALFHLARRRRVLAMLLARALPMVVWIGFATYNSLIAVRILSGTPPQAGLLFAVGSIVFAATASQAGRITALFDSRLAPLVGANGCIGIGFASVLFAPSVAVAGVGITVVGVGVGLTGSMYRSIITELATESLRAGLVGLAEAGGRVAATLTPIAMGGVVATAAPTVGLVAAVQLAGLGAAVLAGGGGIFCLLVASAAPRVPAAETESV